MIQSDIESLLKKSVLADPAFQNRKFAPSREEDRALKKEKRQHRANHLDGWYNMRKIDTKRDGCIEKDLELLQYRNFLVNDRLYRRPEKNDLPRFAEIGTVVCDELVSSRNLMKSKQGKSLYDEWMKSDKLKEIPGMVGTRDIIELGSSALSQEDLPSNLSSVISRKLPKSKATMKKKKKFNKRKLE
ncbi:Dnttip2 protein-like protein [Perkinsela sp. CCAP 1560/4]|nr:Dnttip2 protein-like protein [Perkinsela sp. CCAP 1560/4]|eukprot:KNH04675.1 Dnttip2 protein-like protein [Perkinsela sp. CCAP 1560/4]